MTKPTFDDIHVVAHGWLTVAEEYLHWDWQPDTGPADARALQEAREHISLAKEALDRAAAREVTR